MTPGVLELFLALSSVLCVWPFALLATYVLCIRSACAMHFVHVAFPLLVASTSAFTFTKGGSYGSSGMSSEKLTGLDCQLECQALQL